MTFDQPITQTVEQAAAARLILWIVRSHGGHILRTELKQEFVDLCRAHGSAEAAIAALEDADV